MRSKAILLGLAAIHLALSSTVGIAQDEPKEKPGTKPGGTPGLHSVTVTGCLKAGPMPKSYILTDLVKGPKSVEIVSSSVDLAPHVGRKIEITGTVVPAKDAEADANVPKSARYMKVTEIKMISTTCP